MTTSPAQRLSALVEHAVELLARLAQKEEELAVVKAALDRVQRTDLPELLKELGMSEATLAELGIKVTLTQGVEASIPEAVRAEAFAGLAENGFGDLVRSEVICAFGAQELDHAQQLTETLLGRGEHPQMKMAVPAPTLKAWAKERLTAGEDIPPMLFNVRAYDMARLTQLKKRKP